MESKDSLFSISFIINLIVHYKHIDEEVRVVRIVKIGWILVILGQFYKMWVRSWFQDYRSYDGNKLSLIWHFLNKDERYNFFTATASFPSVITSNINSNKLYVIDSKGSANNVSAAVLTYDYDTECFQTLSNPRKTYVSPKECWFLPNETVTADLLEAGITAENVNDIFYTKGPSMVGHLNCCGVAARMLSQMWGCCGESR